MNTPATTRATARTDEPGGDGPGTLTAPGGPGSATGTLVGGGPVSGTEDALATASLAGPGVGPDTEPRPEATESAERSQRSAIVTGAASGIGRAIAIRLAMDGFVVTVADLPSARTDVEHLVDEIIESGGKAYPADVDVTDAHAVTALVDGHAKVLGGLDVMVANAGITITAPMLETTPEQFERVLRVNAVGVFNCYQAAARVMIAAGRGGRLIGAGSVTAHRAGAWQGAYSASKFAVRGFNQAVALELAEHGITANVYSPGVVRTPMWDGIDEAFAARRGTQRGSEMSAMTSIIALRRVEEPEDVAGVVSFLAGPDAGYITGQSIIVDGGMYFG